MGLVAASHGWSVTNARDARWSDKAGRGWSVPLTGYDEYEAETFFPMLGLSIRVFEPCEPTGTYHWEACFRISARDQLGLGGGASARAWVGEEHVLLALARSESVAGEDLRDHGLTPERLEAAVVEMLAKADPPVESRATDSPSYNPAWYSLMGRAEGLALARGAPRAEPEDVLVALLWRVRLASSILHVLGVDRVGLLDGLGRRGVSLPPGEPEPLEPGQTKRVAVPYDQLRTIVRELPKRLPGARFGFNSHESTRRAWIVVDDDVDGEALVAGVLRDVGPKALLDSAELSADRAAGVRGVVDVHVVLGARASFVDEVSFRRGVPVRRYGTRTSFVPAPSA